MKLKLLFLFCFVCAFFNVMHGQVNTDAPEFQRLPVGRLECPKNTIANIDFRVFDTNTPAPLLIVTGAKTGGGSQVVDLVFRQDANGNERLVDVIPQFPYVGGLVEITLTLTDVAPPGVPRSVTTTFTVDFDDNDPPTIDNLPVVDRDVDISGSACEFTVPDYTDLIETTDLCGEVTVTQSPLAGDVLPATHNGNQTITLRATDEYGNFVETTFVITFKDVTDPTISSVTDRNEDLDGSCNFTIPDYTGLGLPTSDNCGTVTVTQSPIASTVLMTGHDSTQLITLTAADGNGNTSDTTFTITLKDVTDPVFTFTPASASVNLDADCEFVVIDYAALATATDNCGILSITQSPTVGTILTGGDGSTQVITLTAEDINGNTNDTTFTITLEDVTAPAITSVTDKDVDLDGDCNFEIPDYTGEATATDNCGTATITQSPAIGTTFSGHNTTQLITLTANDGNGNTTDETFTITLKDTTDPTITDIDDVTVGTDDGLCSAILTTTPAGTAADNCGILTFTGVRSDALALSAAYPRGVTTITWTATDTATPPNVTTSTQTITVNDDENPILASPMVGGFNALITVDNDPGTCQYETAQLLSILGIAPTATDNCPAALLEITVSPEFIDVSAGPDHPTELITWTVIDSNGNTATETQQILVRDLVLPIMRTKDITRSLGVNGQYIVTVDDIDDGSTDNSGEACFTKYVVDNIIDCGEFGVHDVVLFGKDAWGNQHYSIAKVTIVDDTAPIFVEATLPVLDLNTNSGCTWVGVLPIPATADNCSVVSVTNDAPAAFPVGDTTVTWTVEDAAANTSTITQLVSVVDAEKPVAIAKVGVFLELDNSGLATLLPEEIDNGSTDNCNIDSIVVSPDSFDCTTVGNQVVTLTVTDVNGNESSVETVVTVKDLLAPTLVTEDFTASLSTTGIVSILPSDVIDETLTLDNCGIVSTTVNPNSFTCANLGDNSVTVTVTDASGNITTGTAIVTIEDTIDPTISVTNITVNANSGCTWNGILALPVTADNCSVASVTSDKPVDFAFPVGTPTDVVWTVTDLAGNTATATQVVTVNDSEFPIAKANDFTVVLDATGSVTITATQVNNFSTDNCGIATVKIGASLSDDLTFGCNNVGENIVLLTITDNSGNISTANSTITVVDNIIPQIASVTPITSFNTTGICGANLVITAPTATDICSPSIVAVGTRSDALALTDAFPLGTTIITWNAIDANGNVAIPVTQMVTVTDTENPTITVTNITVDTNAGCIWTGSLGMPITADNCSVASVTSDRAADYAYQVGNTNVVWTVTDAAGNTATATQVVTVRDTEKPIAKATDITIKLSSLVGAGAATITVADIDNGSSDNCGIKSVTISKSSFDCNNVGKNTVVLTVTDTSISPIATGNVSTANAIVTVVDDILPVIASVSPITANTNSGCGASITVVAPSATDNCTNGTAVGTRSDAKLLSADYPLGRTIITWNFTDVNGNKASSVIQTVDVSDSVNPTISVTNITVDTNAGCIWTGTLGLPVAADNCSVASVTSNRAADYAYPVGNTDVVWTVTDAAGNTATATQVVTVRDTEKPIAKATDITIKLSSLVGAGSATITVADIDNGSSDNCGIKSVTISKSSFDCNNVGKNTVVLTVTDNSISPITTGNVSTANAIVTVVDDVLPVIAPISNLTVNTSAGICGANLTSTPSATATDNCTVGTPIGTRSDARALSATYPLGRTTITWNVKDVNGNVALSVIQTVDVTDAQAPVITSNGNKTANADLGGCSAVVTVSATATDNCGVGSPMGVRSDALPLAAAYPVGVTTITWTVTDVNGNPAIAVPQTVTVTDTQRPVITANGNKNFVSDFGLCGAFVAVSATATDNCSVGTPAPTRSDNAAINALYPVGTTTITWNVTDVNGNAAAPVVQTVVVRDLQIPVINGTVVSIDANTDAAACGATVTVTPPTASDNCSVTAPVVGTRSDNLPLNALYPIGSTTITWRVADIYGNVAIPTTTTVKVKDMVLPTVRTRNIPVELNVGGFATIVPAQVNDGSTDNCGIASYSLDKTSFNCSNVGANPVTLTVIDIHGNVNSAPATVTISEPVNPIARALTSVTLQLNSSGTVSVVPADLNNGSTDNCAIFSYALSKSSFNCSDVGTNIVNLTATDTSGNVSAPAPVTVIVQDKLAPVVVVQAYTAILNAFGTVTITPADVNGLSTDNCAIATYSISKSTFTCDNVGENIITLTVTDVNGNSAQAFATVNVVDDIAPKVITKNIELVLVGNSVSITPEDVLVSATDACGVDVTSYDVEPDTFDIDDVLAGQAIVTVYATDVNGNVGSSPATITFPRVPAVANEVITPNGDGTNDTWVIDNITNHPDSVVKVYNTWGSLVFSKTNYQNNWDGKINGNDVTLPDGGSYYYQIDLDGNGTVEEQGWLYITRQ